ncbi:UPF0716 protein FxsA [Pseudoalteromonas citrea]|uniref:UPF0716 protein FxsA n=2 Tax=Pseudoalteromonas citrea TaxID=43655 RepID=A0AAD4AGW0_9GAMM|nr:FxsA family protein [Pseudoalteromonas citrea]KAF7768890.1 UPF0716 protein FxsA [Pseudoalteromonas citrea]
MFRILFVLFIVIPIIEIALLIQVSDIIGGFATIALVVLTAVIGAKLVKQQGLSAFTNVQGQMAQGQMPASELFSGLCVIIAGVLLMTPGIMTDVIGFMLLTPAIRVHLANALVKQIGAQMHAKMSAQQGGFSHHAQQNPFERPPSQFDKTEGVQEQSSTIEGEYQRKD